MIWYLCCFGVGFFMGVILMDVLYIAGSTDDIKEVVYLRKRIASLEAIRASSGTSLDKA